jgi:hypothetical protein
MLIMQEMWRHAEAQLGGLYCCTGQEAWGSKLQPVVAKGTTAAEIIAASTATDKAVYFSKLQRDLETPLEPMTLKDDNQAALKWINNEMEDGLTRYLATNRVYVWKKVIRGEMKPEWAKTIRNVADIVTKPPGGSDFHRLQAMLIVCEDWSV